MIPDKPGIWQRKETDSCALAILYVYRSSHDSLFADEFVLAGNEWPVSKLVGDWELLEPKSQPEIIAGHDQRVTKAQAGRYVRQEPNGATYMCTLIADDCFHSGHKYVAVNSIFPRLTIIPPKPKPIIIDYSLYQTDDGIFVWVRNDDSVPPRYWKKFADDGTEL